MYIRLFNQHKHHLYRASAFKSGANVNLNMIDQVMWQD